MESPGHNTSHDLFSEVYGQLRAAAQRQLAHERQGHTLQATALVHEAFLRVGPHRRTPWKSRGQLVAATAEAMRQVLLDHARARGRVKRGGGERRQRVPLDVLDLAREGDADTILDLEQALERLEAEEPDAAAVVKLRFFACQSVDETARALEMSPRSVDRAWAYGRAWLHRAMRTVEE